MPSSIFPTPPSALRVRSYLLRLPLFTRGVILVVIVAWIVSIQSVFNVQQWGSLIPKEIGLSTMYRTNTFPFIHVGFLHAILNLLALTPLLERFEAEHGTLVSLALFMGPLTQIPALMYTFLEVYIFRSNTMVMGASLWVFILLAAEAVKTYRANPYFVLGTVSIPTWTSPLILVVFVTYLVPTSSLPGHLCGLAVGYLWGFGYLKFLTPPEKILRWIEEKLNLLGRLPHYVSIDQKTYGRYGVLPSNTPTLARPSESGIAMGGYIGSTQRLGP